MALQKAFYKQCVGACLVWCMACSHMGCAPLFQLTAFALLLPFKVLQMVIALLPLAIKYAPLALLFVSNTDTSNDYASDPLLEDILRSGGASSVSVCSLSPQMSCYLISIPDEPAKKEHTARYLEAFINQHDTARVFLASTDAQQQVPEKLNAIYMTMEKSNMRVAGDEKIVSDLQAS